MLAIVYYNLRKVNGDDIKALCDAIKPFYDEIIRMPHIDDDATPCSVVPIPNNNDAGNVSIHQARRAH
jgi:hypothetical protein